jgi:hypothetical protein
MSSCVAYVTLLLDKSAYNLVKNLSTHVMFPSKTGHDNQLPMGLRLRSRAGWHSNPCMGYPGQGLIIDELVMFATCSSIRTDSIYLALCNANKRTLLYPPYHECRLSTCSSVRRRTDFAQFRELITTTYVVNLHLTFPDVAISFNSPLHFALPLPLPQNAGSPIKGKSPKRMFSLFMHFHAIVCYRRPVS